MELLETLKENQNPLFPRREVELEVSNNVSPRNEDVRKFVAEKYSVPEDAVKIHGIYGGFGHQKFKIIAHVYKSKEDLEKTEFKSKKEIEAEKKAEEARKKAEEEAKKKAEEEAAAKAEAEKAGAERSAEEKADELASEEKSQEESAEGKIEEVKE